MPLDIDRYAHMESPIHRWDPRAKIFTLGLFVFSISLLKTIPMGFIALFISLLILYLTAIPIYFITQGMKWVNMFLVPFFLILPFSYPGNTAYSIIGLPFAWEGLRLATLIVVKANSIVLTSYTIFGTSRFDISMVAIQRLKCPKVLIQMLLFTYRYIFVFMDQMKRMRVAMKVRGFVMKTDINTLKVMGNFIGTLLVRSFEHTDRIYNAMLSKGYNGEFHTMTTFKIKGKDYMKMLLILTASFSILTGDIFGPFSQALKGWF